MSKYEATMPAVFAYDADTIAKLSDDTRFEFHQGFDTELVANFADGSVDFVYIDSLHNYEAVRVTIARWFPKLRKGVIVAGHDFCRGSDARKEEPPKLWPRPRLDGHLRQHRAYVPTCGVYRCIGGEFCYPKDKARIGRPKIGFSGVAFAAIEAAKREGVRLQWTQEADPRTGEAVIGNPSWWAVKPQRGACPVDEFTRRGVGFVRRHRGPGPKQAYR